MKNTVLLSVDINLKQGVTASPVDTRLVSPLDDDIQCIDSLTINGAGYLLAFDKSSPLAVIYRSYNQTSGIFFEKVTQSALPFCATMVAVMYLNNIPYCVIYDQQTGNLAFLNVSSDFSLTSVYSMSAGNGITTLKTFSYRGDQFVVAYNMTSGDVTKYQITIDASAGLKVEPVWTAKWAATWTRFSFFQMGAENFFIKTNLNRSKVNIDHFMDDPDEGSHPVLNVDAPAQMLGLSCVNTFVDSQGFPYFVTYRANGDLTINRIYGNCLGWDVVCATGTEANRLLVTTFTVNNMNYILLY